MRTASLTHTPPAPAPTRRKTARRTGANSMTIAFVVICIFLGVGAVNGQNNLLFLLFGIATSTLVVSGVLSGTMMMALRVRRSVSATAQVGRPLSVRYELSNNHWFLPAFAITVRERAARKERGSDASRIIAFAGHVPPRGSVSCRTNIVPTRRGVLPLRTIEASSAFPFGLLRKSVRYPASEKVVVRPRVHALDISRHRLLESMPTAFETPTDRPGPGGEFYTLREYTPGDPLRLVSWRATARTDRIIVQEKRAEQARSCVISLDTRGGHDERERAIELAASLAAALIEQGLRVGLVVEDAGTRVPPDGGRQQIARILDTLALLDAEDSEPAGGDGATRNGSPRRGGAREPERNIINVSASADRNGSAGGLTGEALERLKAATHEH